MLESPDGWLYGWSYDGVSWKSAVITAWSDRPSGGCSRVVTWFGMSDMTRSRML